MSVVFKIGRVAFNQELSRRVLLSSCPTASYLNQRIWSSGRSESREKYKILKEEKKISVNRETIFFLVATALGGYAFYTYLRSRLSAKLQIDETDASAPVKKKFLGPTNVLLGAEIIPPSRRDKFNFIADVVDETAPALVYIQIKNLGVRDFYTGEAITTSNGSGFIVKEDGLILTNAHVVLNKPRSSVQVTLQDGRTFVGVVEDADVGSDLATVRIQASGLPTMRLGDSSSVRPGEFVIAMGSPLSLTNTITTGVVSSPARSRAELRIQGKNVSEYIQTDAAITFGNSGGPLLNLDGEAIGINSMKLTPGISFAIPIDTAKEFLEKASQYKGHKMSTKRRYLGITMVALDPSVVQELRLRHHLPAEITKGILIFRMIQDSPADRAGLRPGDIITHINGTPITASQDIYKFLEDDCNLYMTIIRKGKMHRILVDMAS